MAGLRTEALATSVGGSGNLMTITVKKYEGVGEGIDENSGKAAARTNAGVTGTSNEQKYNNAPLDDTSLPPVTFCSTENNIFPVYTSTLWAYVPITPPNVPNMFRYKATIKFKKKVSAGSCNPTVNTPAGY